MIETASGARHQVVAGDLLLLPFADQHRLSMGTAPDMVFDPSVVHRGPTEGVWTVQHDLFGDGSVVCIPTYGHTPGHQSLKVRTDAGEIVLTGDACYFCRTLRERRLPRFVDDREQMLASLDRLAALERGGAKLFFGHDPEFWKDVPQAPVPAF